MTTEDQTRKVTRAVKALQSFRAIDRKTAQEILPMWAHYRCLSRFEVSEVLRRFK